MLPWVTIVEQRISEWSIKHVPPPVAFCHNTGPSAAPFARITIKEGWAQLPASAPGRESLWQKLSLIFMTSSC